MSEDLGNDGLKRKIDTQNAEPQLKISKKNNEKYFQNVLETTEDRFGHIRKNNLYSDCQFQVGDEIFNAHKIILTSSSPVFEAMFYGSLPEDTNKPITITDISVEIFELLLAYIYEKKVEIKSVESAKHLMYASQKYMIDSLQKECKRYVKSNLSTSNAIEAYEFALIFQDSDLGGFPLKIITHYTAQALNSCNYENISIDTFSQIAMRDSLKLESELPLFNALEKFVEINGIVDLFTVKKDEIDSVQYKIHQILKKIRFLTMTPEEFTVGPATSKLLLPNEKLGILCKINAPTGSKLEYPSGFSTSSVKRCDEYLSALCRLQSLYKFEKEKLEKIQLDLRIANHRS